MYVSVDSDCFLDINLKSEQGNSQNVTVNGFNEEGSFKTWNKVEIHAKNSGKAHLSFYRKHKVQGTTEGYWAVDDIRFCTRDTEVYQVELKDEKPDDYVCEVLTPSKQPVRDETVVMCDKAGFLAPPAPPQNIQVSYSSNNETILSWEQPSIQYCPLTRFEDAELFPLPFSEFRIHYRSTTGVDELFQPDEEPSQEIVVLADSTMLTRSLLADTKTWKVNLSVNLTNCGSHGLEENGVSPLLRTCWWVDPAPSGESGDDLDWQDSTPVYYSPRIHGTCRCSGNYDAHSKSTVGNYDLAQCLRPSKVGEEGPRGPRLSSSVVADKRAYNFSDVGSSRSLRHLTRYGCSALNLCPPNRPCGSHTI
ncbi:hypothetical protein GEV33_005585 [Tenebrio molitor]|uniref:Fibronectin type-III domain-containing protein n=1 Tax=Tenebrio molitor TaxID=7067 RepID=A0A8J6LER5_TENMO|nr:hypothetical protein GEV33_005585 [Tenebrio molitor]